MSLTSRITKLQLANLVYSPISWAVLLAFALYAGILFTDQMEQMTQYYIQNPKGGSYTMQLVNPRAVIPKIVNLLFLFLPLLGMGLISNEINSGTIKLLYSSPIKIRSIVLGKFLAMTLFNTLIFMVLLCIGIGASFYIDHIDWGIVLSFCLGIYILSCTYSAITLFMSSLTRYQIVSAILAIALIYGFNYLGEMDTSIPLLSEVLPWLSIASHAQNILTGYFISVDFLYFLAIIFLFLFATIIKMKMDRLSPKESRGLGLRIPLAVLGVILLLYTANRPSFKKYADLTAAKSHTIPDYAIGLLQRLNEKDLTLNLTANAVDTRFLTPDREKRILKGYDRYLRFKPNLNIETGLYYADSDFTYYEDEYKNLDAHEKMDRKARYKGFDRENIPYIGDLPKAKQDWIKLMPTNGNILFSFTYGDREIPIIGASRDDMILEGITDVDHFTALTQFLEPKRQVAFLQGNKECQMDRGWETDWTRMATNPKHRFSLINNGFEVTGVNADTETVPSETDILVIADPREPYGEAGLAQIEAYIDSGKNLLLALDPKNGHALDALLEKLGITVLGPIATDEPQMMDQTFTVQFAENAPKESTVFTQTAFPMETAYALAHTGADFKAQPVVFTKADYTWLQQDSTQTKQSLAPVLALTRDMGTTEQRILISGDTDLLSDKTLAQNLRTIFSDVPTATFRGYFHWLTQGVYPIDMLPFRVGGGLDNSLSTSYEKIGLYKLLYIGLIPLTIGLFGFFIWFRRSRK